jgi:hypothetical protein
VAASFTQALAQTSVRCCCAIVRPCQFCGTSANTTSQRNRYSSTVSNGPDWPLTSRLNQCQDSLVLDVAHCCNSRAIVSTIKSFDALALPLRVPTASLPSYLPRHINAFLISSSMPSSQPQCLPGNSSPAATVPRDASYICFSLLLFSFLPLSTSHPIYWQSIFNLHLIHTLPTDHQPTSHTTPPFSCSASHNANMKSNYNMLAMAAAAAQANAMPSQHLW